MSDCQPPPPESDDNKSEVWNRLLRTALAMPGARIDRVSFLRKALSPHFSESTVQQAIETRPTRAGIPPSAIQAIAHSSIAWHRAGVTAISFAAGVPGGWWMAGTTPADMGQFFWHVVVILQKLAYLYGWPSLSEDDGELDDQTLLVFTIFVGVMFGASSAAKALGNLAERVAEQMISRLPQQSLTKWGIYRVAREVAKWIGVKLTKEGFARWLSKVIPIVSGFISGGITWVTFSRGSKRLRSHLEGMRLAND